MTLDRIAEGLSLLVLHLGNGHAEPPPNWEPYEWAYVRGIASAEILRLLGRLNAVQRGEPVASSDTVSWGDTREKS